MHNNSESAVARVVCRGGEVHEELRTFVPIFSEFSQGSVCLLFHASCTDSIFGEFLRIVSCCRLICLSGYINKELTLFAQSAWFSP